MPQLGHWEVVWKGVYKDAHTWTAFLWQCHSGFEPRNLKGGIGSLFAPCVNAMGRRPYCSSRMVVSYCTFGFGAVIQRDLCTLSLPCDSPCCNQYASSRKKGNSRLTKLFGGLSYKKIRRYNNSPPYVHGKMAPTTDSPFKFPWFEPWLLCPKQKAIVLPQTHTLPVKDFGKCSMRRLANWIPH